MKKTFLDYVLTLVIILVSIPTLVVLAIITLLLMVVFPKRNKFFIVIFIKILLFMLFVRVRTEGSISKSLQCIVTLNHQSFIDYALVVRAMGYKKKWFVVYGVNLHKYPILRFFLKRIGIGVDRKNLNSKLEASEQIKKALKDGYSVAIFPEGTRMRSFQVDEVLLPFKNGAFSASIETKVPIVPVVFLDTIKYSMPDKPLPVSPKVITIVYGAPIEALGKNRTSLRDETHEVMKSMLARC